MVDFLQHSMHYHVAQELAALAASETHVNNSNHSTATANNEKNDHQRSSNATASVMQTGLERAFLMADIHAKQAGIKSSGATVAVCLIKVRTVILTVLHHTNYVCKLACVADKKKCLGLLYVVRVVRFDRGKSLTHSNLHSCCNTLAQRDESHVHITAANVGDSRIVLGQLQHQQQQPGSSSSSRRLTVDHRMDGCDSSNNNIPLLEVARIERAGGFLFKGRVCGVLAVTRSLGDQILKPYVTAHPAVCEVRLVVPNNHDSNNSSNSNRYFLIVACDGLWDVMTDDEAVQLVQDYCSSSSSNVGNDNCGGNDNDNNCGTDKSESTSKMATAADFLVEQSLRRGTADNVTVVVAWL